MIYDRYYGSTCSSKQRNGELTNGLVVVVFVIVYWGIGWLV